MVEVGTVLGRLCTFIAEIAILSQSFRNDYVTTILVFYPNDLDDVAANILFLELL